MPVRLSTMRGKVRETHLEFDGERVDFAYRPNEFTMDVADAIDAAAAEGSLETVSTLLEPMMVWWDVLDDQDERIPPTAENMRSFPLGFLNKIMDAITDDASPEQQG